MTWRDKRNKHPWMTVLTPEEREEIERIDEELARMLARKRRLSEQRTLIQNRATQRCRYKQAETAA